MLQAGAIVGSYQIAEPIAAGGMGVVYRAVHQSLGTSVALKVLAAAFALDPKVRQRFRTEARVQAHLVHPNIVRVTDLVEGEATLALVMELIAGPSLAWVLEEERTGPWPIPDALSLLDAVAAALECAHQSGVAHRDLKPGNVMLDRSRGGFGVPKVTDFGLAKLLNSGAGLTRTGARMGTLAYMAPEQYMGKTDVDARADVFALGMLAWRLFVGALPVNPENLMAVNGLYAGTTPLPSLREQRPDLPPGVADAVTQALTLDRAARPADATAFRHSLHRPSPPPIAPPPRLRPPAQPTILEQPTAPKPTAGKPDARKPTLRKLVARKPVAPRARLRTPMNPPFPAPNRSRPAEQPATSRTPIYVMLGILLGLAAAGALAYTLGGDRDTRPRSPSANHERSAAEPETADQPTSPNTDKATTPNSRVDERRQDARPAVAAPAAQPEIMKAEPSNAVPPPDAVKTMVSQPKAPTGSGKSNPEAKQNSTAKFNAKPWAKVTVGDQTCTTPCSLTLKLGRHQAVFKRGNLKKTRHFRVKPGKTARVFIDMSDPAPTKDPFGSLALPPKPLDVNELLKSVGNSTPRPSSGDPPPGNDVPATLTSSQVRRVMRRVGRRVAGCAVKAGLSHVVVKTRFRVGPEGHVENVQVSGAGVAAMAPCVKAAIQQLRFPRTRVGREIDYPFVVK